jgi:hypothetical protein
LLAAKTTKDIGKPGIHAGDCRAFTLCRHANLHWRWLVALASGSSGYEMMEDG